jgi:hypothetical protein
MASPEHRPDSGFYADINDSYFPSGYFDPLSAIVANHQAHYKQVVELGCIELPDQDHVSPEIEAKYAHTDFAVQVPDVGGYAWRVIDRGGDLYQLLIERGALRADRPDYVLGNGPDADERLDDIFQEMLSSVSLVNTDGVALSSKPGRGVYTESLSDLTTDRHDGKQLFMAGLAQVYQHELLFENGKPHIDHPREHNQFGLQTAIGFVPLVTMLDARHPVMNQIIREAHAKRLNAADGEETIT